jgi:hypothetical protein
MVRSAADSVLHHTLIFGASGEYSELEKRCRRADMPFGRPRNVGERGSRVVPFNRGSQSWGGCPPEAAHDTAHRPLLRVLRIPPSLSGHLDLSATRFEIEAETTVLAMQDGPRIAKVPSLELRRRVGKSKPHVDFFAARSGRETG